MNLAKNARRTVLICGLLSLATLATFVPVIGHDFVNFDDLGFVTLNPHVTSGLSWANIEWAFRSGSLTGIWHPLTWLSHMLDAQLFGLRPGWHHLTSLLFHATNAVLLFLLLQRMTRAPWRSAAVAALFALHPLHVESVAWVAERKDVLSAFFFMLTLLAYARYTEVQSLKSKVQSHGTGDRSHEIGDGSQNEEASSTQHATRNTRQAPHSTLHAPRFYCLSLTFFALGLMSKPMVVTLPFVLLLLDYWPLRRFELKTLDFRLKTLVPLLLEKLPFFALSAAACVVAFVVQREAEAVYPLASLPVMQRVGNAMVACATYLEKTFWPAGLAVFYPLPEKLPAGVVLVAGAVVLGITSWVTASARRRPHLAVGWCWFLGMLVPVIGLVQVGMQQMADRYTYLPLIGVFVMVVWEVAERCSGRRTVLAALASGVMLVCVVMTSRQLSCWQNSERLFRHALEVTRDNYVAENNLGFALLTDGKLDEAISHYRAAVALQPRWERPRLGLGEGLSRTDHYGEAAEQFSEALKLSPGLVPALVQLGIARARLGQPNEAVQALTEALRIAPDDAGAHNSFGNVLAQQGKHEEAVRQFEEAARLMPTHAGTYNNLAISCRKLGRIGEAITHYREAIRLQPDSVEALNNLAWLLAAHPDAQFRNGADAVQLATRACELTKYQNPVPLATLAAAYAETGQFQTAVSLAEQAQELARGAQGALAARLSAMLAAYRAGHPYYQP
jgi:tetratricopeptide (TPR) repeat protein